MSLKNMKFDVKARPLTSELIQKRLFELGYKWDIGIDTQKIQYTESDYLYTRSNGNITQGCYRQTFNAHIATLTTYEEIMTGSIDRITLPELELRVNNSEHSGDIQRVLFDAGYGWNNLGQEKVVQHFHGKYLQLKKWYDVHAWHITYSTHMYFNDESTLITLEQLREMVYKNKTVDLSDKIINNEEISEGDRLMNFFSKPSRMFGEY